MSTKEELMAKEREERHREKKPRHRLCLMRWESFFGWNEFKNRRFYRALLSEFLCVFILLYYNCSLKLQDNSLTDAGVVRISLTAGLLVGSLVWGFASVSGAHFNPAVTMGFFVTRRTNLIRASMYICVQMLASILAVFASRATNINDEKTPGFVQPDVKLSLFKAAVMEFTITFFLLYVVMACVDRGRDDLEGSRPLTIGLTVAVNCLVFVPLSGGSMNPIRCFGPAIVKSNLKYQWVYWVFSLLGGAAGALLYDQLMSSNANPIRFQRLFTQADYNPDRRFYRHHSYYKPDIEECEDNEPERKYSASEYYIHDGNEVANDGTNMSRISGDDNRVGHKQVLISEIIDE